MAHTGLRLTGAVDAADQATLRHSPDPSRRVAAPVVLHVRVVANAGGGPDKTILRGPGYVDPMRYHLAAAYIHPEGQDGIAVLRDRARAWGCPFYEIAEQGAFDPHTVRHLLALCRKLRVTIWHGHDYKSNALGLLLRRFWPMVLVTTAHGWTWDTWRMRLYHHVDNFCLGRYDHVIVVSPLILEHCRHLGIDEQRLSHIPNGIEPADYVRQHSRPQARNLLDIGQDRLILGVVGRLSPEKGVDRAIRALTHLRKIYPQAEMHLVGDGPESARLQQLAQSRGVGDAVHFHGWQKDPRNFFEAMDVLLLPSLTEGLPNVVLEAMALGVPVAATDVGGVPELLDGGRCGTILDQDYHSWTAHLSPLLVSPERREELARRAQLRVHERYSFAQRMEREVAVYDRLLRVEAAPRPLRRAA